MPKIVIDAQNISKCYRLGTFGSESLRQDVSNWWSNRLKQTNSFSDGRAATPKKNVLWALSDVSFEVREGEAYGFIGHNGAGKSTLLKILSRIIRPTKGLIRGRGKVSSLLEVGTGFHQDLTGRENIFISGHMLGMKRAEILKKFDAIIEFSGTGSFLDTPVKRYSSGMYVRLAFAVAAHLEPDILIVDEVLAVGDAEFQKRCLGKMKEVSAKEGRTVLFVSHNLQAIANLCVKAAWLDHGKIKTSGHAAAVVNAYLGSIKDDSIAHSWHTPESAPGNDLIRLKSIEVKPPADAADAFITVRTPVVLNVEFWCLTDDGDLNVNVGLYAPTGDCIFNLGSESIQARKAVLILTNIIPGNLLNNNNYSISLTVMKNHSYPVCEFPHCVSFDVEDVRDGINYFGKWPGIIRPQIEGSFFLKEYVQQPGGAA